jgi:hypothetical protein
VRRRAVVGAFGKARRSRGWREVLGQVRLFPRRSRRPDRRGQVPKGAGGMPRRHQNSGVEGCEMSGGAAQRASIPEFPSNPGFQYSLSDYMKYFGFNHDIYLYVSRISLEKNLQEFSIFCSTHQCAILGFLNEKTTDIVINNSICLYGVNSQYLVYLSHKGIYMSLNEGGPIQLIESSIHKKRFFMYDTGLKKYFKACDILDDNCQPIKDQLYWKYFSYNNIIKNLKEITHNTRKSKNNNEMNSINYIGAMKLTNLLSNCFLSYSFASFELKGYHIIESIYPYLLYINNSKMIVNNPHNVINESRYTLYNYNSTICIR